MKRIRTTSKLDASSGLRGLRFTFLTFNFLCSSLQILQVCLVPSMNMSSKTHATRRPVVHPLLITCVQRGKPNGNAEFAQNAPQYSAEEVLRVKQRVFFWIIFLVLIFRNE